MAGRMAAGLGILGLLLACISPEPLIDQQHYASAQPALARLAIVPFSGRAALPEGAATGVDLVERFITEEIANRGVEVVAAQELRIAFGARGQEATESSLLEAARVAEHDFRATSVLMGTVTRFREREGRELGSAGPASVAFRVTLYSAPAGKRLWTAAFDETQVALTDAPRRARRYPGGGMRWLTAAELARFGARAAVEALVSSP